ncbi:hypothetical protein [Klenkia terrae]|uniref:Uncharacterized protein n=1 Tax=Klenkia terrae TaxID=1052259 RepID=A0ABU8E627_9ACTN|nr:hypothetical protein [Klenkia terrae]
MPDGVRRAATRPRGRGGPRRLLAAGVVATYGALTLTDSRATDDH